ncbi:MAG TPA: hypothetical protein VGN11_11245 [Candidatus Baltobacteraceae bacterium]|jgi:hypothetical protein|nr:hypothetical protein [Candidatus Baltobacteraceae bacterium]
MSERTVAISLKIPDNAAYTTLTTLQRLGIDVARVERSDVWRVDDGGDASTFSARIESNETIFNPNKHRLLILDQPRPRDGEVWIAQTALPFERPAAGNGSDLGSSEQLGGKVIPGITRAYRYVGWRLLRAGGEPVEGAVVRRAAELLLCNPAIEIAHFKEAE